MSGDHQHASISAGARHFNRLAWSLGLISAFLVVQIVTGLLTRSLALLSDAGHMATDALGLAMALAAIAATRRSVAKAHRTFGLYRLEILAALANSVLLIAVAVYVLIEAARRISDPPEIASAPVLVVGAIGLAVNLIAFALLRSGAEESLNVKGAYLEVVSDALGSVGVIVAALIMAITGWGWVDPVIAAGIGLFIVPRALRLGREALRVLIQAAPTHLDPTEIAATLAGIQGVANVHDLHVWTLTSEMDVLSAHLLIQPDATPQTVLNVARAALAANHPIHHATLQVESTADHTCQELTW